MYKEVNTSQNIYYLPIHDTFTKYITQELKNVNNITISNMKPFYLPGRADPQISTPKPFYLSWRGHRYCHAYGHTYGHACGHTYLSELAPKSFFNQEYVLILRP